MLRKDVKLGFAIGGVMLAVVIVYVLVVPNTDKHGAQLVTEDTTQNSGNPNTNSQTSAARPDGGNGAENSSSNTGDKVGDNKTGDNGAGDNKTGDIKTGDNKPDNVGDKPLSADSGPAAPAANGNGNVWDIALKSGAIPPSMSATPSTVQPADAKNADQSGSAADATDKRQSNAGPNSDAVNDGDSNAANGETNKNATDVAKNDTGTGNNTGNDAVNGASNVAGDNTQPPTAVGNGTDASLASSVTPGAPAAASGSGETTHIVKAGETLSSIAAATYGDARSWKRIADANPGINPNRLAAGMKLVVPSPQQTIAQAHPGLHGGAANNGAIDPHTRYQVQPNDSLYRISMRLYGNATHVQKLYDDNKELIGADPKRLKLGMILKLSDPPATAAPKAPAPAPAVPEATLSFAR